MKPRGTDGCGRSKLPELSWPTAKQSRLVVFTSFNRRLFSSAPVPGFSFVPLVCSIRPSPTPLGLPAAGFGGFLRAASFDWISLADRGFVRLVFFGWSRWWCFLAAALQGTPRRSRSRRSSFPPLVYVAWMRYAWFLWSCCFVLRCGLWGCSMPCDACFGPIDACLVATCRFPSTIRVLDHRGFWFPGGARPWVCVCDTSTIWGRVGLWDGELFFFYQNV
jgi:hypothetical protein